MRIVLASKSPRRSEILNNIGVKFEVVESNYDEAVNKTLDPGGYVKYLAYKKAESVAKSIAENAIVIGADTVVVVDSKILGKPKNIQDAFNMLKDLSGRWHKVYSGVCVIDAITEKFVSDYEVTSVKIKELSDEEITGYIKTGEPLDKAGSYAIQGIGSLIVEGIEGCYFNVVGLPVYKLSGILKQFGVNLLKLRN
jgi:septum formation protein